MEIFFYQSPLEVPFATPYSREFFTDKQVLLISNKSEILGEFETHQAAIMEDGITKIIGTKVFVPVAVKAIFLTWLRAEYSTIHWQAKTEFADFKPEVTSELQAFFQQLRIVEKWEGGTMQPNESTLKLEVEQNKDKFAETTADASKYISIGFALIVVLSLLISLISLKLPSDIRRSQAEYVSNIVSNGQTREAEKLYWCDVLARFFKPEIEKKHTQYAQVCQSINEEKLEIIFSNYELAQRAIGNRDYAFVGSTSIEKGSALWYAKEILNTSHAGGAQKTEEVLKKIIQGNAVIKCPSIEEVYKFSCQHQRLQAVTLEIQTKFPDCKLVCPSPTGQ